MLGYLKAHDVHNVFSVNPMLFWPVDFYSNFDVLARGRDGKDRNEYYIENVTEAYYGGKPVALVDYYNTITLNPSSPGPGINPSQIISFGNQLRVYLHPTRETLEKLGFDMKRYTY